MISDPPPKDTEGYSEAEYCIPVQTRAARCIHMPVDPPKKISETQIIRREEGTGFQQRKKPKQPKKEEKKEPEKTGKVDIKV